jgi:hypothetical protein
MAYAVHCIPDVERDVSAPRDGTTFRYRDLSPSPVSADIFAWKWSDGCGGRRRLAFECEVPSRMADVPALLYDHIAPTLLGSSAQSELNDDRVVRYQIV